MQDKYSLSSVYDDFFNTPLTSLKTEEKEETKDENFSMEDIENEIDLLYISEDDKTLLKKVVRYIENYSNKVESNHINFNFLINSDNEEVTNKIIEIVNRVGVHYHYLEGKNITNFSFYDLKDETDIDKLFSASNSIIVLKDLNAFEMYESNIKKKTLFTLKTNLSKNKFGFVIGNQDSLGIFKQNDNEIADKYFRFHITVIDPTANEVCDEVLERISNVEVTDDFKLKLLDYITNTFNKRDIDYLTYRNNLCETISFNKEIPPLELTKTIDEVFVELNELVGLEKVKKVLHDLVDLITLKNKTKGELKIGDLNLHMVFLGNPGTGKTTVARMICNILHDLKYTKTNKLVEVSSKDLVAEYVGQTAPKTMDVVNKAMGGVLFIDEAYALENKDGKNSYNAEAIATLIKAMEDHRDELVVIFAGYTKEMQDFLDSNSGIVSRIGYTLEFDDYTNEELKQIFTGFMKKAGFTVADDVYPKLDELIDEYRPQKNFGNARFIRNVYEKSILEHAANTKDKKRKSVLKTITAKDIKY